MSTRSRRSRPRSWWRWAAGVGQSAWFFGNLYEGLVGVPQLLADARPQRTPRLLGPGSPVRYYVPGAPLALGGTAAALAGSWRSGGDRRLITATAVSTAGAAALSAYLIRSINVRLLTSNEPLSEPDRHRVVATWHRTNVVRLVALAAASVALHRLEHQAGHWRARSDWRLL